MQVGPLDLYKAQPVPEPRAAGLDLTNKPVLNLIS
jgi:hypothetical protein